MGVKISRQTLLILQLCLQQFCFLNVPCNSLQLLRRILEFKLYFFKFNFVIVVN